MTPEQIAALAAEIAERAAQDRPMSDDLESDLPAIIARHIGAAKPEVVGWDGISGNGFYLARLSPIQSIILIEMGHDYWSQIGLWNRGLIEETRINYPDARFQKISISEGL